MANNLTSWEVITTLLPYIGAGGFTTIIVAYLSFRKEQSKGRQGDPDRAGTGITALLADNSSIEKLVISIDRLALAADKISLLTAESKQDFFSKFESFIDEFRKLRRVIEDSEHHH